MSNAMERPAMIHQPSQLVELVTSGYADSILDELSRAVHERERNRRQEVLDAVREVYGEEAVAAVRSTQRGGLAV